MNIAKTIKSIERKAERTRKMIQELEKNHKGKEIEFTYWGGFSLGYHKGQLSILEELLDDLKGI